MTLSDQLDAYLGLLDARHDGWYSTRLMAGLSEVEIDDLQRRFGHSLQPELRELYAWRAGPTSHPVRFFPTHGVWHPAEFAGTQLMESFHFQRQFSLDAGIDMGELLEGWPITATDGDFVVVETEGPRAGAVFHFDEYGDCFRVTNTLSDFLKVAHRIVEITDTIILDRSGIHPAAQEWSGGMTNRRPGEPDSAWPPLRD